MVAKRLVGPYGQRPTLADGARPSKSVASSHKGSARSARDRTGRRGRKGEMGARDNGEKRKQHTARCLPLPKQRKRNSHCNRCNNSCSSNDRGSKRRNASTVAACMGEFPETSWTSSTNAQNFSYRLKANESADFVKFAFRYSGEEYVGQPPVNVVDWTLMGAVTPVKNREQCDSRWTSLLCQWVWSSNATLPFHEEGTDVHDAR